MSSSDVQQENRPYVFYKLRKALVESRVFGPKFVALRVVVAALVNNFIQFAYLILYLSLVNFTIFDPFYVFSSISELLSSLEAVLYFTLFGIFETMLFILSSREYIRGVNYVKTHYDFMKCMFTKRLILLVGFLHFAIGFCVSNIYLIIHRSYYESEIVKCGFSSDQYCWNAGRTYLMMYGSLTGLYYFITETVKARKAIQFPTLRLSKLLLMKTIVMRELLNLPFNFKWGTMIFLPIYAWMCEPVQCSLHENYVTCVENVRFGSECMTLKPLDSVGNNPYLSILLGSFIIGSIFILLMRIIDSITWVFLTEHAKFDIQPSLWDTNRYILVDAMSSPGFPLIKYLAFYDFAFLTECEPERRRKIFNVSSNGGNPRNWRGIYVECVELINEFVAKLDDTVKQGEDNCFSVPPELLPSIPVPESEEPSYVPPDIVRNLTGNVEVKYHRISVKKTIFENLRLWIRIVLIQFWSSRFVSWLFSKHRGIEIEILIEQQWQPVSWAVQGLASLVHFSSVEDKYGVIQTDISGILDTLLKLKVSLDESLGQYSNGKFHGQNAVCESVRLRVVMKEIIAFSLNRILYACKCHLPNVVISDDRIAKLKEFTDLTQF